MEYFTYEIWKEINDNDPTIREKASVKWDLRSEEYDRKIRGYLERLSKSFAKVHRNGSLHDSKLVKFETAQLSNGRIESTLIFSSGVVNTTIIYRNVKYLFVNYDSLFMREKNDDMGFDEFGYDEVSIVGEKYISHEILFASGATIKLSVPNKGITCTSSRVRS